MASVYDLKPKFQNLLRPLVGLLAHAGVTANQTTLAAAAMSIVVGNWIAVYGATRSLLLLPICLFLRMALNAIDGMLAREHGQKSRLGALLNELSDVVSDIALYLPFGYLYPQYWGLVLLCVFGAALTELAGVLGQTIQASRRYDGPMGKSDRATVFGTLGLLLGLGVPAGAWLSWVLTAVGLLTLLTVVNRCHKSLLEGANS